MNLYIILKSEKEFSVATIAVAEDSKIIFTSKITTNITGAKKVALATLISAIGQYIQVSKEPEVVIISNDKYINRIVLSGVNVRKEEDRDMNILYLELTKNLKIKLAEDADTEIIDKLVLMLTDDTKPYFISDKPLCSTTQKS